MHICDDAHATINGTHPHHKLNYIMPSLTTRKEEQMAVKLVCSETSVQKKSRFFKRHMQMAQISQNVKSSVLLLKNGGGGEAEVQRARGSLTCTRSDCLPGITEIALKALSTLNVRRAEKLPRHKKSVRYLRGNLKLIWHIDSDNNTYNMDWSQTSYSR